MSGAAKQPARVPVVIDALAASRTLASIAALATTLLERATSIEDLIAAEDALRAWADLTALVVDGAREQLAGGEYEDCSDGR